MRLRSNLTFSPSTLLRVSLLIVILLVGCAPAATPEPVQPAAPAPVENEPAAPVPTATVFVQPEATATEAPAIQEVPPTEAPTEVPQVVATSRGPNLEATDPTNVSLNSGELQFVEFFRFT